MNKIQFFRNTANSFSRIHLEEENGVHVGSSHASQSSFFVRTAMKLSRARWFSFLRRVFHYQNGSRSNLGSNPFDSNTWMAFEFITLATQIGITGFSLVISKEEDPVWPMRLWVVGYDIACIFSLLLLYCRYWHIHASEQVDSVNSDLENQIPFDNGFRNSYIVNRCRASLELFFAIWFVMGNVWVFDSRLRSFYRAPKLHVLCISLLAWNAISYSFPFLLFLLLCCCVPLMSKLLGYNMNLGSKDRGALDDEISKLPSWKYKQIHSPEQEFSSDDSLECSICLAKYKEKEEVRKLSCSHMFHVKCVDKWLRTTACCPLCKRDIRR